MVFEKNGKKFVRKKHLLLGKFRNWDLRQFGKVGRCATTHPPVATTIMDGVKKFQLDIRV
jgi:hypothetical protein